MYIRKCQKKQKGDWKGKALLGFLNESNIKFRHLWELINIYN